MEKNIAKMMSSFNSVTAFETNFYECSDITISPTVNGSTYLRFKKVDLYFKNDMRNFLN